MTRIIAGSARGRRLAVPVKGTRPTSDRVLEAMFSTLSSMLAEQGKPWGDIRVLDGYAGSGALGLESLSRGAAGVVLVERHPAAADVIRRNIDDVGLDGARLICSSVRASAERRNPGAPCALVLLDPPYEVAATEIAEELELLDAGGWIEPGAIAVVERPRSDEASPFPPGWSPVRHRAYGDTVLWYGQRTSAPEAVDSDPGGQ